MVRIIVWTLQALKFYSYSSYRIELISARSVYMEKIDAVKRLDVGQEDPFLLGKLWI